jgi:hypothetical protein
MAPLRQKRSEPAPRLESIEEKLDREAAGDLLDVPAAVVCIQCGEPDCPGCDHEQSRSGVVSVIAWERTAVPPLTRLWSTARATTHNAESFFELLPDGPVLPALRFAAICELLASSAMLLFFAVIAAVAAPEWVRHLLLDPRARAIAARVLVVGVPAFAGLLVLAHVAHGLSIDLGARKHGGREALTRALRFGLYACGWDLVIGPIGAVVLAAKEGLSASLGVLTLASGLPTASTRAFLRGCYRLEGDRAREALGTSYVGAAVATIMGALVVLAGIVVLALA